LCAEVHCQVYAGVGKETELGNMAVDLTRGMILEYDSKPVDAIYSSNCGGHTQGNIFGEKNLSLILSERRICRRQAIVFSSFSFGDGVLA